MRGSAGHNTELIRSYSTFVLYNVMIGRQQTLNCDSLIRSQLLQLGNYVCYVAIGDSRNIFSYSP